MLAKGIQRVPYVAAAGELAYLIDQSAFIAAVEEDPRVRLGGVGHLTAVEPGGTQLGLVSVGDETLLVEAFEHLQRAAGGALGGGGGGGGGAVAVTDSDGSLIWSVSGETLELISDSSGSSSALSAALSKPIRQLYTSLTAKQPPEVLARGAVCCGPGTTLRELVALAAEHRAQRIFCVDEGRRPLGVVSLTSMIRMIVDRNDS